MKRTVFSIAAGALCGMAWGHEGFAWLIGLSVLVPPLWHGGGSRCAAGATALAFYLAASRGLPFGAGIFFAETAPVWFSWALWLAAGLVNAAPWFVLWSQDQRKRVYTLPFILALTAVPPIGIIGWTNPLTAAAVFYPGMGFVGLFFFLGLVAVAMLSRWPAVAMFAGAAVVANVSAAMWPKPPASWRATWSAHDTHFQRLQTAKLNLMGEGQRVAQVALFAEQVKPSHVLVLPETVLPQLSQAKPFTTTLLADVSARLKAKRSTILVGAEVVAPGGPVRNVLIVLGDAGSVELNQRVPVPIGMWRPWSTETISSDLLGNGIGRVAGRKIAYLICYEQLLVFPVLLSMVHSPDLIVGAANDWWARNTSIPTIQAQALDLWGRLFGVPVVRATNI